MDLDVKASQIRITEFLQKELCQLREIPAIVSSWIIVAELVGEEKHLLRLRSDNMTVWQQKGMLHDALFDGERKWEEGDEEEGE